jgi:hypothetical protein
MVIAVVVWSIFTVYTSFCILGVMNQRRQLKLERARFAHLKRLSNGRSWR